MAVTPFTQVLAKAMLVVGILSGMTGALHDEYCVRCAGAHLDALFCDEEGCITFDCLFLLIQPDDDDGGSGSSIRA